MTTPRTTEILPPNTTHGPATQQYRGFTLRTVRAGHTNIETNAGFFGGYSSVAAAQRRVDQIIQRRNTTVERVTLEDGRTAYRVHIPELGA